MTKAMSRELAVLVSLSGARRQLFDSFVSHAADFRARVNRPPPTKDEVTYLSSGGIESVAELFFVIEEHGLATEGAFEAYLLRHNASLSEKVKTLLTSKNHYTSSGLGVARLEQGQLTPKQIQTLAYYASRGTIQFDQTCLGKLLIEIMSLESSRELFVLMGQVGLLDRGPNGEISSNGSLERYYRQYLQQVASFAAPAKARGKQ